MKPSRFLIIPCAKKGRGSGHILRSLALRRSLETRGAAASLLLDGDGKDCRDGGELSTAFSIRKDEWLGENDAMRRPWDMAVFDNFSTDWERFERFRRLGYCVGIDEGGPARPAFDYLIDILPRLQDRDAPNIADALTFLDLPPRGREFPAVIRKILISMGGEDFRGSGPRIARGLADLFPPGRIEVSLIRGALSPDSMKTPPETTVIDHLPELKSRLKDYDLVICQFGLTAYEALASGTAILLQNPSRYHEALSRAAGFPSLGALNFDRKRLASFISRPESLFEGAKSARERLDASIEKAGKGQGSEALAEFLSGMELPDLSPARACVACSAGKEKGWGKALWRDESRSYFPCPRCGSIRLSRARPNPIVYDENYFFEEYRRQYGRTYLEDFPALRRMAGERLDKIESIAGGLSGKRALDIGCAYGAFLAEARDRGCSVFGIDAAREAVDYARTSLGVEAVQGFFPDERLEAMARGEPFDIVSMWYVAEHLSDLSSAFRAVRGLLKPGGILALSTPSASGVSSRFRPDAFFRASPPDHLSVLSPRSAKRVFADSGFRLRALRSTGHHPERLPFRRSVTSGYKYDMLLAASRLFALGDTFEAYASRI